jgi:hypothetical protein
MAHAKTERLKLGVRYAARPDPPFATEQLAWALRRSGSNGDGAGLISLIV